MRKSYEQNEIPDADNFYAERSKWLDYLVERADLTHGEFRVAYFIASKINPGSQSMWWGMDRMAEDLPVSLATMRAATESLSHKGLLVVSVRKMGKSRVNQYSLRMPFDPYGDKMQAMPTRRKKTGGRKRQVSENETLRVSKNETKSNKA